MLTARAPTHILLIDDHALIRSGLRMVVQAGVPGALLREAASIAEAMRDTDGAPAYQPALVLLDIELPGLNGLDGLTVLRKRWPATPVVMLSSHTEPETVRAALARGAVAYVAKSESSDKIIAAIDRALRGSAAVGTGAVGGATAPDNVRHAGNANPMNEAHHANNANNPDGPQAAATAESPRLTPRQCEVLDLLCEGLSNKVIGRRLDLSENTVRGHVQAVLAFLSVSSRSEAAFAARKRGLVR